MNEQYGIKINNENTTESEWLSSLSEYMGNSPEPVKFSSLQEAQRQAFDLGLKTYSIEKI